MQISRLNITTADQQLRRRKFKQASEGTVLKQPQQPLEKSKPVPIFGLECSRFDKSSNYQKFILSKLAYLQNLSENKYTGSPHRRKNSSLHDKATQKLLAVIQGRDGDFRRHVEMGELSMSNNTLSPKNAINLRREKCSSRKSDERPSTVGEFVERKRKNKLSLLYENNKNYIRLQPYHIESKQLSERPSKNQAAIEKAIVFDQAVVPPLRFHQPKEAVQSKTQRTLGKTMWVRKQPPFQAKQNDPPHRQQRSLRRPLFKLSEDLKPWESFQLEEI